MGSALNAGLLATKLHRPPLPPKRVERPPLAQRLNDGLESGRGIILVSAPAGFGKTICVCDWVDTLDRWPVAWLSLDPADDDPGRFFTYLIAALQKVDQRLGAQIEGVLRAGQLPPAEIIYTTLINELLDLINFFILVLDDFQVIQDPFILGIMQQLVENLPPAMRLVLLTREDPSLPLARLRANNQLTEVRAGDLRFTTPEAARFLNEVMDLSLSQKDIAALEERTEGWIVGLQLAGLSIRDREDPSAFIANLSGSHRFILSYLTEEVLNQQSQAIQEFLLHTAILERLNGDLCNAVTGREDSHNLLEGLVHANLFLIPLDDEGRWYRYHQLFADLLRDSQATTLQADEISKLHQRASRWYAQASIASRTAPGAGGSSAFATQAIQHAVAAEDYEQAVRLLESYTLDMLLQWHLKTVESWMQAIPPEWGAKSPKANLAFAWMHLLRGSHLQAVPYLERLGEIFSAPQTGIPPAAEINPSLQAEWLAMQATLLNAQRQPAESLRLAKQALEMISPSDGHVRSMIYLGLADAYHQLDDVDHALEAYQILIQCGRAAGNLVPELVGASALALMLLQQGRLHEAFELVSQVIDRVEHSGSLPPISTALYGELGVVHYQWHQLEQAHHFFQRAIQVSKLSGYSDAEVYYGVILSRLFQIAGNLEAADREMQKVADLMRVEKPATVQEEALTQQVRIYLARDRLAAAERALKEQGFSFQGEFAYPNLETDRNIMRTEELRYISALRILLYRARVRQELANLEKGLELAERLIGVALERRNLLLALETLLLRAQMHSALGDQSSSQADICRALALTEPEGFISVYVEEGPPVAETLATMLAQGRLGGVQPEYVKEILAAFPTPHPPSKAQESPAALVEPLTVRELEVLQLMAEGLKYKEIAGRLYISLNTVRSHVKVIYGKLNVNNRTRAITLAAQLKLFDP